MIFLKLYICLSNIIGCPNILPLTPNCWLYLDTVVTSAKMHAFRSSSREPWLPRPRRPGRRGPRFVLKYFCCLLNYFCAGYRGRGREESVGGFTGGFRNNLRVSSCIATKISTGIRKLLYCFSSDM